MAGVAALGVALLAGLIAGGAAGQPRPEPAMRAGNPLGHTTVEKRIVPRDDGAGFRTLRMGAGEDYMVREDGIGVAQRGRAKRRRTLAYFGQISDLHIVDEESPARVEFVDPTGGAFTSAWRAWEALVPNINDSMVRQMNAFADHGPVRDGRGARGAMDFVIDTGDSTDSQQYNETRWVRTILDGGRIDPNSGIDRQGYRHPLCPRTGVPGRAEARRYTGVQDYDDYPAGPDPYFYDPSDVRGTFADFPSYPGLMDRAQKPFTAAGLDVPSYVAFGNHDGLVQGNAAADWALDEVATGCLKPFPTPSAPAAASTGPEVATWKAAYRQLTPERLRAGRADPDRSGTERPLPPLPPLPFPVPPTRPVPPDPGRHYVSKPAFKRVIGKNDGRRGHGFGLISKRVERASNGAAGYYSFTPRKHLRMIALDTVSEAGVIGVSDDGNVDNPQFRWLRGQLRRATEQRQRVILFSHHAIQSLTADVPDEAAPPCRVAVDGRRRTNPGCDLDPRDSEPIRLGPDLLALLHRFPNVIAWVAGHSHVNDIEAYPAPGGNGGFWMIRTAAETDWPQQGRLLQLFDNRDGTLSIFGTIVDHASPVGAPPAGTKGGKLGRAALASIGRTLAYNDNQTGARDCDPACGEGLPGDRNVELLIGDPLAHRRR